MELREGFKQTEVGVIPNDWDVHLIQNLIDEKAILDHIDGNHGELYPRSHEFKQYGIPYVAANTLVNGQVNFDACKFLSEERAAQFRKGIAKDGDVLFAHNATVGPVAALRTKLNYVILSTTVTYFRCNPDEINNAFLLYNLQAQFFVKQYQAVMSQSTRNQVPITAQRKFSLVLPATLKEQTAIANALSDADALIQSLTRLIAKKRQIKKGAIQSVVTGQKRLPGFFGDWKISKLGTLFDVSSGGGKEIRERSEGKIFIIEMGSISENGKLLTNKRTDSEIMLLSLGELVMPTRDIGEGKIIGKVAIIDKDKQYGLGNNVYRLISTDSLIDVNYFYYLINSFSVNSALKKKITKSVQLALNKSYVEDQEVSFPATKKEQTAIAMILSDIDAEIAALETKLAKYQKIKQGMMQNLLTGRIRLVKPENKAA